MYCTTIQLVVTTEPIEIFVHGGEAPQICFQELVDNFGLTINLGMIGSVEMQLGALEPEQFFPEVACESWITVKDYRVGHSMEFEDIVHKNLSHYVRL
jgi:hypothetical protein